MKRIVSFGDSWTYGAEIDNPLNDCYTSVLSRKTGIKAINYGDNGRSFALIASQILCEYTPAEGDIVLVCIPPDIRWMGEDEAGNFITIYTVDNYKELRKTGSFIEKQFRFFNEVVAQYRNWSPYFQLLHLFSIQEYLKNQNIPVIFMTNYGIIDESNKFKGRINKNNFLSESSLTTLLGGNDLTLDLINSTEDGPQEIDSIFVGEYFEGTLAHPNELGHEKIAELIYNNKIFQQWLM